MNFKKSRFSDFLRNYQRKVTKETRPAIADSPLKRMVSVARAKTR